MPHRHHTPRTQPHATLASTPVSPLYRLRRYHIQIIHTHVHTTEAHQARRELGRALKILTTHEGEKAASTTLVREHLGLLAYYEEDFEEAQKHFRDVHDILVAHGRAADDEDVVRQLENLATATCRTGPRTWA